MREEVQVTEWLPEGEENEAFLMKERERILASDPQSLPEIRVTDAKGGKKVGKLSLALFRISDII